MPDASPIPIPPARVRPKTTEPNALASTGTSRINLRFEVEDFLSTGEVSTARFVDYCVEKALMLVFRNIIERNTERLNDSSLTDEYRAQFLFETIKTEIRTLKLDIQNQARQCVFLFEGRISQQLVGQILDRTQVDYDAILYTDETTFNLDRMVRRVNRLSAIRIPSFPELSRADQDLVEALSLSEIQTSDEDEDSDSEGSETEDSDLEESGAHNHRIWNHLTISRDQTSAADSGRELLLILYVSKSGAKKERARKRHIGALPIANSAGGVTQHNNMKGQGLPANQPRPDQRSQLRPVQSNEVLVNQFKDLARNGGQLSNAIQDTSSTMIPDPSNQPPFNIDHPDISSSAPSTSGNYSDSMPPRLESYDELCQRIASLEYENKNLKSTTNTTNQSPSWQVLHFIEYDSHRPVAAYLDEPCWSIHSNQEISLDAYLPVVDVLRFLRQRKDLTFVVGKYYSPRTQIDEVLRASRAHRPLPSPECFKETISLNSKEMIEAARAFFDGKPDFEEQFPGFDIKTRIPAPYLFWYHYRSASALDGLSKEHKPLMEMLVNWIEEHYKEKYDHVESQLSRGVISQETMPFLVKPGDVIVWENMGELNASIARSWAWQDKAPNLRQRPREGDWGEDLTKKASKPIIRWTVDSWRYEYDGQFLKYYDNMDITFKADWVGEEVEICKLSAYPLKFAPASFEKTLEKRGKTFWKCRYQNLVSYEDSTGFYGNGERFVIDFQTYRQLHEDSVHFKKLYSGIDDEDSDRMSAEKMESSEPPASPEIYIFPNSIPGYDLRSKKWEDLDVDLIRDVTWNKKSFDHLVVDPETKELVQALVMRQIAREKSTDIIERKGNGLIMLLHGGPGTGKTFTAESVAELAEKPLFRVTCGDIGTDPEGAEKYLESVLHLGKTWGCVVLIDEAEVFLEQRSLDNLERNALVSVFLRVLEYYEGILILTSNRVGTFDEAFKSRILLSLHYENLTQGQRMRIWKNFLRRLKEMETDKCPDSSGQTTNLISRNKKVDEDSGQIDFDDVECYLTELSQYDLNGRQIRNAITAARQLAMFRDQPMSYQHLKHVITVSSQFDNYLKKVQEGQTADQIARIDGIR